MIQIEWIEIEALDAIIGIPRGSILETQTDPDQRSREVCVKEGERFHMKIWDAHHMAMHNSRPPFAIIRHGLRLVFDTKQGLVDAIQAAM